MGEINRNDIGEEIAYMGTLIKEYGGVDSYTTTQAVTIIEQICKIVKKLGLNPENRADLFEGVCRIFNIELVNMQNFEQGKYIFVPNHVSEFDGFIFGTLIPNMMVVAKSDWISYPRLNEFIEKLFTLVGVVRKDKSSGLNVLRKCAEHLGKSQDGAVTIFVQQTIVDLETTTPEDVASGALVIAKKADAPIIPVYCEQVSTEHPTRIVFGSPLSYKDKNDFGEAWLKSEIELRDSLANPVARRPMLCEKHRKPISEREF